MNEDKSNNAGRTPQILLFISGIGALGIAAILLIFGGSASSLFDEPPVTNVQVTSIPPGSIIQPIEPELNNAVQVGEVAPNFTLTDLDGNEHTLDSLRGKPVIINFWATWCAPCRVEMPELEQANKDYADENLVILALNREESPDVVEAFFVEEMGLTFTPLLDSTAVVADIYGVFNMPTTYFINSEGVVSDVHRGPVARVQLDAYLEKVFN